MRIQEVTKSLVEAVDHHLIRHVVESGREGLHWLPFDPSNLSNAPMVDAVGLHLDPGQIGWQRWHVVLDENDNVIGHLSLKGSQFDRGLHRAELAMGLELTYRSKGIGNELVAIAIAQAERITSLDWLDLHVLSCNPPALSLYEKTGFKEVSRIPDFCRIDDQSVDDVLMSRWVGKTKND